MKSYIGQNIKGRIKCVVRTLSVVAILGNMHYPRTLYPNTLHITARSMYSLILSVLLTFHTQGLVSTYFPRLEKHKPSVEEKGGIGVPWSLDLDPLLDGPKACLARITKRPKPTYRIKTKQELTRKENFKAHLRKTGCLVKDSLHGSSSRISSPPASYPTLYGKFVIDNHMKA